VTVEMTVCRLTKKGRASFKAYETALRGALFEAENGVFGPHLPFMRFCHVSNRQ